MNQHQQESMALALGARLKALREATGMTRENVSDETGIEFTCIGMYERGDRIPSLTALVRFAVLYETTVGRIVDGDAT